MLNNFHKKSETFIKKTLISRGATNRPARL